jgi:translation initiation factor 3 subunit C
MDTVNNEHSFRLISFLLFSALDHIEELLTLLSGYTDVSYNIYDDLIALILQMDQEFTQILQNTDPHSQEYIERLKDEFRICSILDQFKIYFESNTTKIPSQHLCTIYLCIIEHIYYKTSDQSSIELIDHLCKYIYTNDTSNRTRTRAILCQIYHFAKHNCYNKARDLMLMCHVQDTVQSSDISTQILYNRTIVQIGLCTFRFGMIREAHQALVDIQSGNRIKDLLGQDILPYHMHINLQLIECIYLISAMLIEIPSRRKHLISKHFHILMYQAEKQPILGPPESMREHIVAASHALKTGDWNICVNFLINEKMNNNVWKLISQASKVIEMLINKIKQESLGIYLFTYASSFSSISMVTLADMFELSIKQVYGIISKMTIDKELMVLKFFIN